MEPGALAGKVALITAACQGIGSAIAAALAAQGATVALHRLPGASSALLEKTAVAIEANGGRALMLDADLTNLPQIAELFDTVERKLGGIDIVVSNAVARPAATQLRELSLAAYDEITALNAKTHFFVLQQAGRRVRDNASIVVVSSGDAAASPEGQAAYAGATAAAELYCRVLAKEIGARGVTVNAVAAAEAACRVGGASTTNPDHSQDAAEIVAFLATHEARWITAQIIRTGCAPV